MAGFDIVVTVEVKPHPGTPIMEKPAKGRIVAVADDTIANRVGSAQMCGTVAYEAVCALLGVETRPETMVRLAGFSDAELEKIFGPAGR
jgi:hypothetical protein